MKNNKHLSLKKFLGKINKKEAVKFRENYIAAAIQDENWINN